MTNRYRTTTVKGVVIMVPGVIAMLNDIGLMIAGRGGGVKRATPWARG